MQGQNEKDVDQLATLHPEEGTYTEKEQVLLGYVKVLTLEPSKVRDTDVQRLRNAGWTDEQIFETSFITSLFAFFNRMADAYGLDYPANGWLPEELRAAGPVAGGAPSSKPAVSPTTPPAGALGQAPTPGAVADKEKSHEQR